MLTLSLFPKFIKSRIDDNSFWFLGVWEGNIKAPSVGLNQIIPNTNSLHRLKSSGYSFFFTFSTTMRFTLNSLCLLMTLLIECTKANIIEACPGDPYNGWPSGKAVYFQSNEQENSVISIPIGRDGKLYGGMVTSSGGKGGAGIDGTTKKPAAPDALSSQGSVVVSGDVSLSPWYDGGFSASKLTALTSIFSL